MSSSEPQQIAYLLTDKSFILVSGSRFPISASGINSMYKDPEDQNNLTAFAA